VSTEFRVRLGFSLLGALHEIGEGVVGELLAAGAGLSAGLLWAALMASGAPAAAEAAALIATEGALPRLVSGQARFGRFPARALGRAVAFARGEGDAPAFEIDLDDRHGDPVADFDDLGRIFHELIGQARDVDEAVLVHADVDEGAEGRDIGDSAFEDHADLEIGEGAHVVAELGALEALARIAAGLEQLGEDVVEGEAADVAHLVTGAIDAREQVPSWAIFSTSA
jgi:hypothetical protein